ncbi:MAG: hypothetical protein SVJ22_08955 [Halobacteriota archaeon]|nr:hypothetical protein [Halobacteriota archaeon]
MAGFDYNSGNMTVNGSRGFCAPNQTLTKYIWEYLGHQNPYKQAGEVDFILSDLNVSVGTTSANITFTTNLLTNSSVGINGQVINDTNYLKNNSIIVIGLTSGSTYDYNITYRYNASLWGNMTGLQLTTLNETVQETDYPPTVTLFSPQDGDSTSNLTILFNCSATDDVNLKNITLYGNWSGGWHANETVNLTGTSNSKTFSKTLPEGSYKWNALACDNNSNAWGASNFTFDIVQTKVPIPPKFSDIGIDKTSVTAGERVNIRVNVTGDIGISWVKVKLEHPGGDRVNYTMSLESGPHFLRFVYATDLNNSLNSSSSSLSFTVVNPSPTTQPNQGGGGDGPNLKQSLIQRQIQQLQHQCQHSNLENGFRSQRLR